MKYFTIISLLIMLLAMSACSSKTGAAVGPDGQPLTDDELAALHESRFGEGEIPLAEGESIFRDVHFAYDSSKIPDQARQDIEYNVEILRSYPDVKIQLEGHCDERGTAEYNMALGSQRARSVYDELLSYGIAAEQIDTISYGEELPLEEGSSEQAYSKNRRVHFSAYKNS